MLTFFPLNVQLIQYKISITLLGRSTDSWEIIRPVVGYIFVKALDLDSWDIWFNIDTWTWNFSIQFLRTKLWWGTFRPLGRSFMNVYLEEHNWKLIWHAEIAKSKHLFDETTLKTYSDSFVYIIKRYFSCFHTWPLCL